MRDYHVLRDSLAWYHAELTASRPKRYVVKPCRTKSVSRQYDKYVESLYDYMTFITPNVASLRRNDMMDAALSVFDEWNSFVKNESGLRIDIPASWRGYAMRVQGIR